MSDTLFDATPEPLATRTRYAPDEPCATRLLGGGACGHPYNAHWGPAGPCLTPYRKGQTGTVCPCCEFTPGEKARRL